MKGGPAEIEEQVEKQPRLGIALMQMLVKRSLDYEERLQSFALDKTPERVVRTLLRFADRLGKGTLSRDDAIVFAVVIALISTTRIVIWWRARNWRSDDSAGGAADSAAAADCSTSAAFCCVI